MKQINNSECLNDFGQYIRTERERQKIYQTEMAQMLGISQAYYSMIEQGKREIDLVLAIRLCSILKLSLQDFVTKYI